MSKKPIKELIEASDIPGDDPIWEAVRNNHTLVSGMYIKLEELEELINTCKEDIIADVKGMVDERLRLCSASRGQDMDDIRKQTAGAQQTAGEVAKFMEESGIKRGGWLLKAADMAVKWPKMAIGLYVAMHVVINRFTISGSPRELLDLLLKYIGK